MNDKQLASTLLLEAQDALIGELHNQNAELLQVTIGYAEAHTAVIGCSVGVQVTKECI